jgi:flagellar hook-length control protein FliK
MKQAMCQLPMSSLAGHRAFRQTANLGLSRFLLKCFVFYGKHPTDMNLSALNSGQSPSATPVSTEANNLGGALSRPSSGTQSGEDFAAFLRHQIASLQSPQRQELAADSTDKRAKKSPTATATKGMLEQQALRQAFHPNQYLHAKTPGSKGMGMLAPGGHFAKHLPPALPHDAKPRGAELERHKTQAAAKDSAELSQATDTATQTAHRPDEADEKAPKIKDSVAQEGQALQSITLSPEVEIITVTQPATSEKSLTDFALAMGLDASQIKALLGDDAAADAVASTPAATTQQILAMNTLPGMGLSNPLTGTAPSVAAAGPTASNPLGSSPAQATLATQAVLGQALPLAPAVSTVASDELMPQDMKPIGLEVQWSSASADLAANKQLNPTPNLNPSVLVQAVDTPDNISTLAVLSMMDADLRPEDIDRLKEEFDKLSAIDDSSTSEGTSTGGVANNRSASQASASPAQTLKTHPDMAQTFEKLSQKLATEMASRMNEQLNAGEWKMKFALKPASLGLVDVQLEMRDGQLSAQFHAENGLTKDLIQNGSTRLKEALAELGMNNAYVSVGQDNRQSSQGGSGQSGQRQAAGDNRVTLGANGVGEEENAATPARHSNSALFDTYA